jgi:hypothetical protein
MCWARAAALRRRERAERDRVSAWVFPPCGFSSPSVAVCSTARCSLVFLELWVVAGGGQPRWRGRKELNAGTRHGSVLLLGLRQCLLLLLLACVHGGIRRRHLLLPILITDRTYSISYTNTTVVLYSATQQGKIRTISPVLGYALAHSVQRDMFQSTKNLLLLLLQTRNRLPERYSRTFIFLFSFLGSI